ncbi:MAG: hypothetical protein H0W83_07340 [Planctomycetes bacterium]|nr:hypothetical protein [Planctomycetota bacterium]
MAALGVMGTASVPTSWAATEASGSFPGPIHPPIGDPPSVWAATEDNILGPYHRPGAPFRAKVSPPLAPGSVLLVGGCVYGLESRAPIPDACIDIWHADAAGHYDNEDPAKPPAPGSFAYRARMITDAAGYYEFETIRPGAYRLDERTWRPRHVHYRVTARGCKPLVTQLYFRGELHNDTDAFIKPSLIVELHEQAVGTQSYHRARFDIVLARAS